MLVLGHFDVTGKDKIVKLKASKQDFIFIFNNIYLHIYLFVNDLFGWSRKSVVTGVKKIENV